MDLDRYEQDAFRVVAWCMGQLEREGVAALWQSCISAGSEGMRNAGAKHGSEIQAFLSSEPDERAHILQRLSDRTARHLFLIAATYTARCGWAFLQIAADKGVSASYNPQSGFLLGQAAAAALELHESFPTMWPFEDYADPFE